MKNLLLLFTFLFVTTLSFSQVSVRGYYRSNGTYVKPHQRTKPNHTRNDNYSTIGNINPYTGTAGTHARDSYTIPTTYKAPRYIRTNTRTYSSTNTPSYKNTTNIYTRPTYSSSSYTLPTYSNSRTIHTGPRGGRYYINSNGNKTYVKR